MSYRPIGDTWWLARCKYKNGQKRYGGYLGGFPERARVMIGCPLDKPMLHVCGGLARQYPYKRGFGQYDRTMDLDPACLPDYLMDARDESWPRIGTDMQPIHWGGILIDPPYTEDDAAEYPPGRETFPNPHQLVKTAINTLRIGYKVGIIGYIVPRCPKNAMFVASVDVKCGFGNRTRTFDVFERTE